MSNKTFTGYTIDHIEIYTPMAKVLAYWHVHALGFTVIASADQAAAETGRSSYVLQSGDICIVLTSSYPGGQSGIDEVGSFIAKNYCGVKRIALQTGSVKEVFEASLANGAIPLKFPSVTEDEAGSITEASIRLYNDNEILFINRQLYKGVFKPGYAARTRNKEKKAPCLISVDHIASELRINEMDYWSRYLTSSVGTHIVQRIQRSDDNRTGMILNINQTPDKRLTFVMAEPDGYDQKSKVQQNINKFGPGIHHLAFATDDLVATSMSFAEKGVEFVTFPSSYFDLLRSNEDFKDIDIDQLQQNNILIDKEEGTYLLQKFIKPISDRPFFLYEIVQRVNGYSGFALKNINVLKKAEELEILKSVDLALNE